MINKKVSLIAVILIVGFISMLFFLGKSPNLIGYTIVVFDTNESWNLTNGIIKISQEDFIGILNASDYFDENNIIVDLSDLDLSSNKDIYVDLIIGDELVDSKKISSAEEKIIIGKPEENLSEIENITENQTVLNNITESENITMEEDIIEEINITMNLNISEKTLDSCAYAGSGDWVVNCSENCFLNTDTSLPSKDLIAVGTGTIAISAEIDVNKAYIMPGCKLYIKGNGKLD